MQLSDKRKIRLAAVAALGSAAFLVYMLSGSGPVGPPFRDEALTAGPEPLRLVDQPSIRKELRLSEKQVQQIQAVVEKQSLAKGPVPGGKDAKNVKAAPKVARMGRKHQEAFLTQVLQPQQVRRLRQIVLQRQGGLALGNHQTAEELGLTEAQRKKADAIIAQLTDRLNEMPRASRGPEGRKQVEEKREAAKEELLGLLTPEQQAHWTEMLGEPLVGEIGSGPPGRPGGPPGGPDGGRPPGGKDRRPGSQP
jgi:hypothetical protein